MNRRAPLLALLGAATASAGCGGAVRFRDQPIVWEVDDRRDIPEPEEIEFWKLSYFPDIFALRRAEKAMAFEDLEPARNTNALDEVPDSSWFQNRIGRFDLSAADVARGPCDLPPPAPPLVIQRGKTGGGNLGFVVKDAADRQFLIKFDRRENPEMQTGTNTSANRLVWAFGFHVPRDYLIDLRREDLSIGPKATAKNDLGDKIPYTEAILDAALASSPPPRGGVYRATASEMLEGKPKGGWPSEGVRPDDPNDVVPHQHRRELRGLRVLSAWINHTDMKDDNALDMYVERGGRRFLEHHLIDFGEAFGGHGAEKNRLEDGYEHYVDWNMSGQALLSFGLWKRPWEQLEPTPWRAVGAFTARHFDPATWKEAYPYWPFWAMDRADAFWAAKIVLRFRRPHIEAAIAEGRFTEPGAAEHLVWTLEGRRDAIGRTWLEALSALDGFEVEGGRLCMTDLGKLYGLASAGVVEALDDDGEVAARAAVDAEARACLPVPPGDGYHVASLRVRRGSVARPRLEVHLRGGARPRVLGLVRDPDG